MTHYSQYKHENDIDVVFKRFPEGDIIALFPNIEFNHIGGIQSYMHIGQHGEASPELVNELADVDYSEYADLLIELVGIGCNNLHVLTEQTVTARRKPTASEIRFGYGATHYADFNLNDWINQKTGKLKQWIKSDNDNLRYYR